MKNNTVVELFAGVGGFRLGLEPNGWKTVFSNQWEPGKTRQWAFDCYQSHFPESRNINTDIAQIPAGDIPDHALLVGGFPCQDYSVAATLATSKGIQGKKGVLWWEIYRIVREKLPRFILLENVDRLLASPASQRGRDFGIILSCLNSFGYSVEWKVINAGEYGFAQRRKRTFIFATNDKELQKSLYNGNKEKAILKGGFFAPAFPSQKTEKSKLAKLDIPRDLAELSSQFSAPFADSGISLRYECWTVRTSSAYEGPRATLGSILQKDVDEKYYIDTGEIGKWQYMKGAKHESRTAKNGHQYYYSEGPIAYPDHLDRPSRTLLTSESSKSRSTHLIADPQTKRMRLLTPVECERLDGFPDGWTDTGMPEKFRYFCMGNALVVGLIALMGKRLQELNT